LDNTPLHHRIGRDYPISFPNTKRTAVSGPAQTSGPRFADVLEEKLQPSEVRISAHAAARLNERGVQLTSEDLRRIGQAVDLASKKGVRDAYLVYQSSGLVVNVPNRTVVTAMHNQSATVVTNVDGVVIV
jgi:flagellar operon protein